MAPLLYYNVFPIFIKTYNVRTGKVKKAKPPVETVGLLIATKTNAITN
jgi:hypothetical protein